MLTMEFILKAMPSIDTLVLDLDLPEIQTVIATAAQATLNITYIRHATSTTLPPDSTQTVISLPSQVSDDYFKSHINGETRLLLGPALSAALGGDAAISYRIVTPNHTLHPANALPTRRLRVLHLVGSTASRFYDGISTYYASQCIANIGHDSRFEHLVARVTLTNQWVVARAADVPDLTDLDGPTLSFSAALAELDRMQPDVVVPHMFDYLGLTSFRGLADILQLPLVGCTSEALALSTHKARTNAVAAAAGVPVPPSQLVRGGQGGDLPTLPLPIVVKPVEEDNSLGVKVVREASELKAAVDAAAGFGDGSVLCEQFIPLGRELRVGLVERGDGELDMLPVIEYELSDSHPIRGQDDKVRTDTTGTVTNLASGGRVCPAEVDKVLREKLFRFSSIAHRALGCRDYSIFDYRVDPNGEPFMLETCLYCSFAPKSVLVSMLSAIGVKTNVLFERLVERALTRRLMAGGDETQGKGMKRLV